MAAVPNQAMPVASTLPVNYRLGEYVVEKVLGRGGFGITYLAKDSRLGARVAIKEYFPQAYADRTAQSTIRPLTTPEGALESYRWGLQQFLKEARALAQFKHNHIVRVLRFLEVNSTAYMVMEYEEGESLVDLLQRNGGFLNEPALLGIFLPILSGLQAVHDAGLLHLDIKPDNIYLRANGQPMLIDFGSARQSRDSEIAQKVALTPGFCALEQYPGHGQLGPAADVYGMGATLYRCITGRLPVDARQRHNEVERSTIDPLPLATSFDRPLYAPCIRESIDHALRLNAADRPPSAFVLQHSLMGKDVAAHARPSQSVYRYRSGYVGVTATHGPEKKRRQYSKFEKTVATAVFLAAVVITTPKILIGLNVLDESTLYNRIESLPDIVTARTREWRELIDAEVFGKQHSAPPPTAYTPPPAPALAPTVANFVPEKTLVATLTGQGAAVAGLAFTPNGARLIAVSDDGTVKVWDAERAESITLPIAAAHLFALSADGRVLALPGDDNAIRLWDLGDANVRGKLPGHRGAITALAFTPDGKYLASAGTDNTLTLWDTSTYKAAHQFERYQHRAAALAFAPNGKLLIAGDSDGGIAYIDTSTYHQIAYSPAHQGPVTALVYSPDGQWLASGGSRVIKLWRTGANTGDLTLTSAPETVHAIAWSPDGKYLYAAGTGGAVLVWNIDTSTLAHRLTGPYYDSYALALSPNGSVLAIGGDDKSITVWK